MTEITFRIEHTETRDVVTVFEDGIKTHVEYYHKGHTDCFLILNTTLDWFGTDTDRKGD